MEIIENILGKIERIAEAFFMGPIYERSVRRASTRADNQDAKEDQSDNYIPNISQSDYRK